MTDTLTIDGVDLSAPAPGRVLPPRAFTSPAVYDAELDRIFPKSWVLVADTTSLQTAGDFVTANIGTTPVVVVRGHDGEIRTFLNACRHRGTTVAEGSGNCGRSLDCPYHAWSYATDGRLIGVPDRDQFSCDLSTMGLVPVRTGVLAPMVFACLDADAPSFEAWIGASWFDIMRAAHSDEMHFLFEYTYDVDVNWKVYVENGLEGYHVRFVHDMLDDFVETHSARHYFGEHGSHTHAFVKPEYVEMAPPAPHLMEDGRLFARFGHVFPNLIPVLSPDEFSYLRIDPVGPEKIRLVARSFAITNELEELRRESLDRTNKQDIGAVTRVQQGLRARGLPAGAYACFLETRIGHFERMVARALSGGTESVAEAGPVTLADRLGEVA